MKAAIIGLSGPELLPEEAALLRSEAPAGVILFARNIVDPAQLHALIAATRAALPPGAVLMVDQEGGRVARLRPPHWRAHPPAGQIGELALRDRAHGRRAAWLTGALIGLDCVAAGFDVAAAPVLDVRVPGAHDVIGDRAYAEDPALVAELAGACAEGLLAAGCQPVGKHAPGHGRAGVDSHLALPTIEAVPPAELLPFQALAGTLPWMMTAHVRILAWDPVRPATLSPTIIEGVIRGEIGFLGVLVSDDLAMQALSGSPAERAAAALTAGCDIALHCSGRLEESASVLAVCPELTGESADRFARAARLARAARQALDSEALAAERDALLA
jgi:beta-N-acetylhexosaminidase